MDGFQSADVIIFQVYVLCKETAVLQQYRDLIPVSSLPENTKRINWEEDGDVNVRGENNTLTLSPH